MINTKIDDNIKPLSTGYDNNEVLYPDTFSFKDLPQYEFGNFQVETDDIILEMEKSPLTLTAKEISELNDEGLDEVVEILSDLVQEGLFTYKLINGQKVYWSTVHNLNLKNR